MQDIDFDEIDRAVSSVSNSDTPSPAPAVVEPTPAPVDTTPVVAPRSATVTSTPPVQLSPSLSARRSTGRFMDVVHSSSDMRPERADTTVPAREAVAPRDVVAPREEPVAPAAAFQWPDPIDLHESKAPEPAPVADVVVPEPVAVVEEPVATPLESPFLTDAKVEKRPLGAFSSTDQQLAAALAEPVEEVVAETIAQPELVEEVTDVPAELGDDLLGIEGVDQGAQPLETTSEIISEPAPVEIEEELPTGPTSIVQQYKEQPTGQNETSGAIFDTEAYHAPLVHAPKKRSGLLVVSWVLALIVIGGGIGAIIYFFVLPMLG